MIACLFIRSKSPRPFHALLLRGVPWAKTFFYTSSRAAFTAIITTFFRGHGMTLFLVLFNRCRVPPFPARESPSALSGRARILMSGWLFKRLSLYLTLCIFIFSKAQTHSSGSAVVLFRVQSLFNKDLFLVFLPHCSFC